MNFRKAASLFLALLLCAALCMPAAAQMTDVGTQTEYTEETAELCAPEVSDIACTADGICLSWYPDSNADGIYIYGLTTDGARELLDTVTDGSCSWTDTSALRNGTVYRYLLFFYRSTQEGERLSSGCPASICYLSQSKLVLTNFPTGVHLSWGYNSYADGYRIYRSTDGEIFSPVRRISSASVSDWTDTSVKDGETRYYKVVPVLEDGNIITCGVPSEVQQITCSDTDDCFSILADPMNRAVSAGQQTIFTVRAAGSGLSYCWQCYDFEQDEWTFAEGAGADTAALTVTMTEEKDGALYRCIVANEEGDTLTSRAAALTLKSKASAISDYTFAVCGASYDAGTTYQALTDGSLAHGADFCISWSSVLASRAGTETVQLSKGGATTRTWLKWSACRKAMLNTEPLDLYILTLGGNDTKLLGMDLLGSLEDIHEDYHDNPDTFYGNYARIIEQIMEHAPNAKLVMTTPSSPWNSAARDAYCNAVREIAEYYGIPFIDWKDSAFMTSAYYTGEDQIKKHPTTAGYAEMALAFEDLFDRCVRENPDYFAD